METRFKRGLITLFAWGFSLGAFGCTDFILQDANQQFVVGRSMEFGINLKSQIFVQTPTGLKTQSMIGRSKGASWTQKYTILGINVFGNNQFIVDGMNDQGLSLEYLWFPGAQYPTPPAGKLGKTISLYDLGSYLLGTCATISDVKAKLSGIFIYVGGFEEMQGQKLPLHLAIHEATGASIVIEFIDNQMVISDNKVGVLTNSPSYSWQTTNLNNYVGLSSTNMKKDTFGSVVLSPEGQGSGLSGLPGGYTPPARFVRIAFLKFFASPAKSEKENVNLAWHLLNTVDIPYGVIRADNGQVGDYTQWSIVKDLKNKMLYYRTYDNLVGGFVDLNEMISKGSMDPIPLMKQLQ